MTMNVLIRRARTVGDDCTREHQRSSGLGHGQFASRAGKVITMVQWQASI